MANLSNDDGMPAPPSSTLLLDAAVGILAALSGCHGKYTDMSTCPMTDWEHVSSDLGLLANGQRLAFGHFPSLNCRMMEQHCQACCLRPLLQLGIAGWLKCTGLTQSQTYKMRKCCKCNNVQPLDADVSELYSSTGDQHTRHCSHELSWVAYSVPACQLSSSCCQGKALSCVPCLVVAG